MAPVPHADQAIVDLAKVAGYLLSSSHPIGKAKAVFFNRFGFREDAPDELVLALLDHVLIHSVANSVMTPYGVKYRVDGPLASPDGRNPRISSAWIVLPGELAPRFITAFPC
jgi:hypothetical protein